MHSCSRWNSIAAAASAIWNFASTASATPRAKSAIATRSSTPFVRTGQPVGRGFAKASGHKSPAHSRQQRPARSGPLQIASARRLIPCRIKAGLTSSVCIELLQVSGVKYQIDPQLVRGFDYYTETLWEVTAAGLGSQNALGGGGRYDNLVENLGGRPTPGVGFGSGLERLLIALEAQGVKLPDPRKPFVWIVGHGKAARESTWNLLALLRQAGIPADMDLSDRSMKAQSQKSPIVNPPPFASSSVKTNSPAATSPSNASPPANNPKSIGEKSCTRSSENARITMSLDRKM